MTVSLIDQIGHCTVRIECDLPDGETATGTGFFFGFDPTESHSKPFIVTNFHVIEGSVVGRFVLTLQNDEGGPDYGHTRLVELKNFESLWVRHPDPEVDLAVMPLAPILSVLQIHGEEIYFSQFGPGTIPSPEEIGDLFGTETIAMVGYPSGLWDEVNNLPILRRGGIASPLDKDWKGKSQFVIDTSCIPGSSGSPVMLFDAGFYRTKRGTFSNANRVKLLGVLFAGPVRSFEGEIEVRPVHVSEKPVAVTDLPINLGYVIKASRIMEFEKVVCS